MDLLRKDAAGCWRKVHAPSGSAMCLVDYLCQLLRQSYRHHRFLPEIIRHAVWLHLRITSGQNKTR
jgi:hypothetical protein